MRSQLRLRVLVPLVVVAVAGLGFVKLGLPRLAGSEEEAAPASAASTAPSALEALLGGAETGEAPAEGVAGETAAEETPAGAESELEQALEEHRVVVLVVAAPQGAVDSLVTLEARTGANDGGAGFVAVNALKEKEVASIATAYDIRDTPAVLIFVRGPELTKMFLGYADRETVAQAVQNAKRAA